MLGQPLQSSSSAPRSVSNAASSGKGAHQLGTLVSELRRLDEESVLMEASRLLEQGDEPGSAWWMPWAKHRGTTSKDEDGPPTSSSYVARLPLEVNREWVFSCLYLFAQGEGGEGTVHAWSKTMPGYI